MVLVNILQQIISIYTKQALLRVILWDFFCLKKKTPPVLLHYVKHFQASMSTKLNNSPRLAAALPAVSNTPVWQRGTKCGQIKRATFWMNWSPAAKSTNGPKKIPSLLSAQFQAGFRSFWDMLSEQKYGKEWGKGSNHAESLQLINSELSRLNKTG